MKNSVFAKIILVQVACIVVGVMTICGFLYESASRNEREALLKIKQSVYNKIHIDQEKVRAWSVLGLNGALNSKFKSYRDMVSVKNVEIVDEIIGSKVSRYQLLIPSTVDDGVAKQILVTLDEDSLPIASTSDSEIFLILIALAGVLVIGLLYSTSILKNQIYSPLSRLFSSFENIQRGNKVDISSIQAKGEISAFVNGIAHMHNKTMELEASAAIAQTTQMLAHDVRKPFTMLKSVMDMISLAPEGQIKKTALVFLPEVKKSIHSVNAMISNVMEVGSNIKPQQESTSIEVLIESALNENLRYNKDADIKISYAFSHKHELFVENIKISRVVSNIVINAIQAMNNKGDLWFKTRESNGFMEINIGNSNSYISPSDCKKLFDSFFTKNKKGGTGLGLAIARKIISAHGGDIWCKSEAKVGTDFYFTLPLSTKKSLDRSLPSSSQEIRSLNESSTPLYPSGEGNDLEDTLQHKRKKPFEILLCDDESLYRNHMRNHINNSIAERVKITTIATSDRVYKAFAENNFDLVILDVDLGKGPNGLEVAKTLRKMNKNIKICIHSNRELSEAAKDFMKSASLQFMPKPMSRNQLLSLIINSNLEKVSPENFSVTEKRSTGSNLGQSN